MQNPYPLGRVVNHDPRSRLFPAPYATGRRSPVKHKHYGPVLDQGTLGSCTGNAMAQLLNTRPFHRLFTRRLTEKDAVRLYSAATGYDEFTGTYPPEDTGSSGLAVCKAAQAEGRIGVYTHAFGIDHVLDALQLNPVLLGVPWYEGMFETDAGGYVTPTGDLAGGHEIFILEDIPDLETVTLLNSWGPGWGINGLFHMSYDTLDYLLRQDGDATVPLPK